MIRKYPVVNGVMTYPDGREVGDKKIRFGRLEYTDRTQSMWRRQDYKCAMCQSVMQWWQPTFDHQDGRGSGGGHRDDRIETEGKWHNAALCNGCNSRKGSIRYHWNSQNQYVPCAPSEDAA